MSLVLYGGNGISNALSFPQFVFIPALTPLSLSHLVAQRVSPPFLLLQLFLEFFLFPLQLSEHVAVCLKSLPLSDSFQYLFLPDGRRDLLAILDSQTLGYSLRFPENIKISPRSFPGQNSLVVCKHLASGVAHRSSCHPGKEAELDTSREEDRGSHHGGYKYPHRHRDASSALSGVRLHLLLLLLLQDGRLDLLNILFKVAGGGLMF